MTQVSDVAPGPLVFVCLCVCFALGCKIFLNLLDKINVLSGLISPQDIYSVNSNICYDCQKSINDLLQIGLYPLSCFVVLFDSTFTILEMYVKAQTILKISSFF
jgi:hypothetical protein